MQQPTCTNVRIRSTVDAHRIFTAIQRGALQMVTRRLDAEERLALRSGCVYAWEERGPHTEITGLGIERFTEGRRWSPSRVRDEFLFYYEKYTPTPEAGQSSVAASEKQPPRDWDPLVKQTYSVWVETEKGRRKWHLTAYFTQYTVDQLKTIDQIPGVGDIEVPDGVFTSTRTGRSRGGNKTAAASSSTSAPHSSGDSSNSQATSSSPGKAPQQPVSRTYAPYPSPGIHIFETYTPIDTSTPFDLQQHPVEVDQSPQSRAMTSSSSSGSPSPSLTDVFPSQSDLMQHQQPQRQQQQMFVQSPVYSPDTRQSVLYNPQGSGWYGSPVGNTPASYSLPQTPHQQQQDQQTQHEHQHEQQMYGSYQSSFYPQQSYENFSDQQQNASSPSATVPPSASNEAGLPTTHQFNGASDQHLGGHLLLNDFPPYDASNNSLLGAGVVGYYLSSGDDGNQSFRGDGYTNGATAPGAKRDLAPLHTLKRAHPYKRDPVDDRTLRRLGPRPLLPAST